MVLAPAMAAAIHYPEHWDTSVYPTLEDAILAVLTWHGCPRCQETTF